jgi:hypothetical protein
VAHWDEGAAWIDDSYGAVGFESLAHHCISMSDQRSQYSAKD